jgi:hypothetical protein
MVSQLNLQPNQISQSDFSQLLDVIKNAITNNTILLGYFNLNLSEQNALLGQDQ